jgi:transposase-like protein
LLSTDIAQLDESRQGRQAQRCWRQSGERGKMEVSRLRTENIRLQRQVEILKKATAFFAKDAL